MPLQHLFTKREQRIVSGITKESVVEKSAAYWAQNGYRISFYGPYQMHGEHVESRLGLRQVVDLSVNDFNKDISIDLSLSATLGDTEAVVGVVGLVVLPLAAVVIGGVSYLDYDTSANRSISNYWNFIFGSGSGQTVQVVPQKCKSCGALLDTDAAFCKRCGTKVE